MLRPELRKSTYRGYEASSRQDLGSARQGKNSNGCLEPQERSCCEVGHITHDEAEMNRSYLELLLIRL